MKLHRREYHVTHGHTGFHLTARDVSYAFVAVDNVSSALLAVLGHPCGGKGPLGRIPFTDVLWWKILNLPCRLARFDRPVLSLDLTTEQAMALRPEADTWDFVIRDGWDEDGELYFEDSRLVKVRCKWCSELLPANGRHSGPVYEEHDCSDAPVPSASSPWEA